MSKLPLIPSWSCAALAELSSEIPELLLPFGVVHVPLLLLAACEVFSVAVVLLFDSLAAASLERITCEFRLNSVLLLLLLVFAEFD